MLYGPTDPLPDWRLDVPDEERPTVEELEAARIDAAERRMSDENEKYVTEFHDAGDEIL